MESRISAFARRHGALPLPGTMVAIRGVIVAAMAHAQEGYSECSESPAECTCPEEALLVAAACAYAKITGTSADVETARWVADFWRHKQELS